MTTQCCFLVVIFGGLCSSALAVSGAWYGGGGYDGHDLDSARPAIGCPQVSNAGGATNVLVASAWLNGMLLSTGSAETVVYVYWGTTNGETNKGDWGAWTNFGVGIEGETLTTNVSVMENTTYYYRFYATNAAGDEGWADASAIFTTPGPPTLDTGVGAAPVGFRSATLNGRLAAGGSTTVFVCWGQDTNAWSGTNSLGLRSVGAFYTAVSGLNPGTLYYYRCYGTNTYGDGWSDIAAFTVRVISVSFTGGSYDGHDRFAAQIPMAGGGAGTIFIIK